jgi:hypothetical protein
MQKQPTDVRYNDLTRRAAHCRHQAEQALTKVEKERWSKTADHWWALARAYAREIDDQVN